MVKLDDAPPSHSQELETAWYRWLGDIKVGTRLSNDIERTNPFISAPDAEQLAGEALTALYALRTAPAWIREALGDMGAILSLNNVTVHEVDSFWKNAEASRFRELIGRRTRVEAE